MQTWQDAVEFLLAGASAVAIGNGAVRGSGTPNKCAKASPVHDEGRVERLDDLIGALEMRATSRARPLSVSGVTSSFGLLWYNARVSAAAVLPRLPSCRADEIVLKKPV